MKISRFGKKGVSTIIATILMANIVIVMFVIILAGFMPSIGLATSKADVWYSSQKESDRERIAIEMIYFNETAPKTIDVYVRNVGEIDVKIAMIFVNGEPQINTSPVLPGFPIYVKTEEVDPIEKFSVTYDWAMNTTYIVKVATARGNRDVSTAQPP